MLVAPINPERRPEDGLGAQSDKKDFLTIAPPFQTRRASLDWKDLMNDLEDNMTDLKKDAVRGSASNRLPGETENDAKRRILRERIGESVLKAAPNVSWDNLRHLQAFLARTVLGLQATRIAKRTETLMKRATTKAVDMTSLGQERFFADLARITERLRERFMAIGKAQDAVGKAEVDLDREIGEYDKLLDDMGQLIRPGPARNADDSAESKTPTRRAAVVQATAGTSTVPEIKEAPKADAGSPPEDVAAA
jgi:hypothetical protein